MKKLSLGQISDYEIKQLKVFKTVVECGGFSAAAAELNISRPTVSNHIASLESRLGMTLCKRGRSGFILSAEGSVVYEQTNLLLDQMDQFRNTINNLGDSPNGVLRIALSDTFSTDQRCKIPEIYSKFCKLAPNVTLKVEVEHMSDMERQILNDQLDLAFIPYHRKLEGLHYIHLFTDNNYLHCGRGHPFFDLDEDDISIDIINKAKLIHAGLQPHEEIYQNLSQMNLSGSSYHYESRIGLILSGEYICFLPEEVARPYVEGGQLRVFGRDKKHFALGAAVIFKHNHKPNRAKELFIRVIQDCFSGAVMQAPY
ncbi:MAG: LysR family transcriptional regulator [Oceanospirillum sp.]|nr:LysR family transcriptional regulator [Oceanospirillum sp.]